MKYFCAVYTPQQEKGFLAQAKEIIKTQKASADNMEGIIAILNYADWKYYVKDNPVLADKEYDTLFTLLKKIEAENPSMVLPDSPTQRVAKGLNPNFETVPHLVPMLSLDNSYNAEDLQDWHERNLKLLSKENEQAPTDLFGAPVADAIPIIEYCVEPKFE